ncbi:MAG: peptidylprolyl isomerase [Planctomycetaceae bacterium]|nr:peptidylprolyl isomerase [Planctomycetaceae bacterium]
MSRIARGLFVIGWFVCCPMLVSWADEPAANDRIAAKFGAATITVADVDEIFRRLPGHENFSPAASARVRAETLAQLVNKALVIARLDQQQFLPHEKPWEARWVRYLAERITDDDVRKFFEQHKRDFDGTELRVSHVLFKVDDTTPAALTVAIERAKQIRGEIVGGKLTFAAAAAKHSAGPSRDRGGDLGFIQRRGPMAESFSRAAFALEPGAISEPVVSPFGVHLIQVTEVKPGRLLWTEASREVREVMAAQLLRTLADEMRPQVTIEFTGESPYLDAQGQVIEKRRGQ